MSSSESGNAATPHPKIHQEVLTYATPIASLKKTSFIATAQVYEVTLKMLQYLCSQQATLGNVLDQRSLTILEARTLKAVDTYRKERYWSDDDSVPLLQAEDEGEQNLIDLSDEDGADSEDAVREALRAMDYAIKCWLVLRHPGSEVLDHLKAAHETASSCNNLALADL